MGKKWKIENHEKGSVCIRKNNKNKMDLLKWRQREKGAD